MQNGINFETWYEDFNRFAGDLYPGRYTRDVVKDLVEVGRQVQDAAKQKHSLIVAHNYQYPELQEVAREVGDSLGLSRYVADQEPTRVDFCGVWFMGETAKTILGDSARSSCPIGRVVRLSTPSNTCASRAGSKPTPTASSFPTSIPTLGRRR